MEELSIPQKMNVIVGNVLKHETITGFEKAYLVASAIDELSNLLTPVYMKPIMALQNRRLGFKCDKVYSEREVKECLIEAVFLGLQPYGNEFNIIAGNCYPTKEGMGALLKKIRGLKYSITPKLPRVSDKSAAVVMVIVWEFKGITQTEELDIPIKVNSFMGTDAIIGKATRKARAWLYGTVTGTEIVDGDVTDADFTVIKTKITKPIELTKEEITEGLSSAIDQEEINELWGKLSETQQLSYKNDFDNKEKALIG